MFSSFTDYQFTEENDNDEAGGINVQGENLSFVPATLNYTASATITGTETIGDELDVFYSYHKDQYDDDAGEVLTDVNKKAIMRDAGDGKYRIVEIVEAIGDNAPKAPGAEAAPTPETAPATEAAADTGSIRSLYEGVLTGVQNGEYEFPQNRNSSHYQYFVADINGDGIQDLGVDPIQEDSAFYQWDLKIFTAAQSGSGYQLAEVQGDQFVDNLYLAADGNGLFEVMISRGTGDAEAYRITISDGSLVMGGVEQNMRIDDDSLTNFANNNPAVEWKELSDTSGLDALQ